VEHGEQVGLQDNFAYTQGSEPGPDLLSNGGCLLTGHCDQRDRRPFGASQGCCCLFCGEPDGVRGLADAGSRRISPACAAVAVGAPRGVERNSASAGATRVEGQKDLFQFGLISCE
jgi:hypothetical protein